MCGKVAPRHMAKEQQKERQLEKLFKAFANKRRLAIIRYLKRADTATVGEIASEIRLSFKATSKHLRILAAADIVEQTQQRLHVFYQLARDRGVAIRALVALLQ